jgi:hypothetical protein
MYSVKRFKDLGFKIANSKINQELKKGVIGQRNGHHGDAIHKMWDDYNNFSNDEAARSFEVELIL